METVKSLEDIKNLEKNRVEGNPEIVNSTINFKGQNNILYCEGNVKLSGANVSFEGNNSIIYLSSAQNHQYPFNVVIYNDSTLFIGRENNMAYPIAAYPVELTLEPRTFIRFMKMIQKKESIMQAAFSLETMFGLVI